MQFLRVVRGHRTRAFTDSIFTTGVRHCLQRKCPCLPKQMFRESILLASSFGTNVLYIPLRGNIYENRILVSCFQEINEWIHVSANVWIFTLCFVHVVLALHLIHATFTIRFTRTAFTLYFIRTTFALLFYQHNIHTLFYWHNIHSLFNPR